MRIDSVMSKGSARLVFRDHERVIVIMRMVIWVR